MQESTVFFDKKAKEAADVLSPLKISAQNDFFIALDEVNKKRRLFSETLTEYYYNYSEKHGIVPGTNIAKEIYILLEQEAESLDSEWHISQRTVQNWLRYQDFSLTKAKSKINFYHLSFSFGLSREETSRFFFKLFAQPAFSRNPLDLIFEYAFYNGLNYKQAIAMWKNYRQKSAEKYEAAFNNAYNIENNSDYINYYASALNCDSNAYSLINHIINQPDSTENAEILLKENSISDYLSNIICSYEKDNCTQINRKMLDEVAANLVSPAIKNKYINRISTDNSRINAWREGKGTPELMDSFADRLLMYALIRMLKADRRQISDLILLSVHNKAKRFLGKDCNGKSDIDLIRKYIDEKKDSSLPAACAEDIEIFSFIYYGAVVNINTLKESFLNTHGKNSMADLFELDPEQFANKLHEFRLEFSINNVRARNMAINYLQEISADRPGTQTILQISEETDYAEYDTAEKLDEDSDFYEDDEFEDDFYDCEFDDDRAEFRLTKKFWIETVKKYFEKNTEDDCQDESEKLYFPWFWVIATYGYSNKNIIKQIFKEASEETISCLDRNSRLWVTNDVSNTALRNFILKSKDYNIADFYSGSSLFDDRDCWGKFMEYFDENEINIKYEETKKTFIRYCNKKILNLYEKKMNIIFRSLESDDSIEGYKRFLCSAFKNMPSPLFIEGNHFETGKGNMNTYEQLRSLLIFLHFFVFYKAKGNTFNDYKHEINALLSECGFSPLYSKEPLDFVFLTCAQSKSPMKSFSLMWNLALQD